MGGIILDCIGVFLLLLLVLVIRVALFMSKMMGLAVRCTAWTPFSYFHRGHGGGLFPLDHILYSLE